MTGKIPTWAGPLLPLTLLLGGCAGSLRPADIALPGQFEAKHAMSGQAHAETLDRWWTQFDDPQLTQMIESALASAPDARSARAVLDEALANRRKALSAYDPQGALSGSATRQRTATEGASAHSATTYVAAFSPSWEIGRASCRERV